MHNPFARLHARWHSSGPALPSAGPYAVSCACGQVLQGTRSSRHQIVSCPACARPVFILPLCALAVALAEARRRPRRRDPWRTPLVAAALTAAFVVAIYLIVWLQWKRVGPAPAAIAESGQVRQHIEAGRQKLAEGRFYKALEELNAALRLHDQSPGLLSTAENRQLLHLHQQTELLTRLLSPSLQEILREACEVRHEEEWQARFNDEYRGKAVVFDDVVRRDEHGVPLLHVYEVRAGMETARVALDDLTLLRQLPLEPPPRLLFGVRLASLAREKGGRWVFRLQPDSAVLLTDPGAVAACGLGPLDAELLEVLRRQAGWLK